MGQHHARIIAADPSVLQIGFIDLVLSRAKDFAERHNGVAGPLEDADLVVVAASTPAHSDAAVPWLSQGARVLVEKPIALDLAGANRLQHPQVWVGHSERFNPGVRGAQLHGLHRLEAHRVVPRAAGADVVTDLLVHDIDLMQQHVRNLVCLDARGDPHTSVWSEWEGDGFRGTVHVAREGNGVRHWLAQDASGNVAIDLLAGVAHRDSCRCDPTDDDDALQAQWRAFRDGASTVATAKDGATAVRLAHEVLSRLRIAP